MIEIGTQIKAKDIEPGMVIDTAVDKRFTVERVEVKWGAVQVRDHIGWRGLGERETVTVRGYFNP